MPKTKWEDKIELYEIWDKRVNIPIIIPKEHFKKIDIHITTNRIWIALKGEIDVL